MRRQVSYDVITPLAARGLFEAIHWTPSIWWRILTITVLNRIDLQWRSTPKTGGSDDEAPSSMMLENVAYVLEAAFEMTDESTSNESAAQHAAMFRRRARSGRFFRQPFLGVQGLAATIALMCDEQVPASYYEQVAAVDLGWMLCDRNRQDPARRFYRPTMRNGVIDLRCLDMNSLPT